MKNILADNLLRFGVKNLSESDIKKLHEQQKPGEALYNLMNSVAALLNKEIDAKIQADPRFPQTKLTVERSTDAEKAIYNWKYGPVTIKGAGDATIDDKQLMGNNGAVIIGNLIKGAFNVQLNPKLPKTLQQLRLPGLLKMVDGWVANYTQQTPAKL